MAVGDLGRIESLAVVRNEEGNHAVTPAHRDGDISGPSVLSDIREGLLNDPVNVRTGIVSKEAVEITVPRVENRIHPVGPDKIGDKPPERGSETLLFKHRGAQLAGQSPYIVNHLIDILQGALAFIPQFILAGAQSVLDRPHLEFHERQGLAQFVVQFPGYPSPLLFLRREELRREELELLLRFPERFFRRLRHDAAEGRSRKK
jgi:hypothetical protein